MLMKVSGKFYRKHYGLLALLTLLSILAYCWGWYVSTGDGVPFARSGAISTAILVFMTVSDYAERLLEVRRDIHAAMNKSGNWTSASELSRKALMDTVTNQVELTRKVIQYWYAALLFAATFIWGLGDLLYMTAHDHSAKFLRQALKIIYLGGQ